MCFAACGWLLTVSDKPSPTWRWWRWQRRSFTGRPLCHSSSHALRSWRASIRTARTCWTWWKTALSWLLFWAPHWSVWMTTGTILQTNWRTKSRLLASWAHRDPYSHKTRPGSVQTAVYFRNNQRLWWYALAWPLVPTLRPCPGPALVHCTDELTCCLTRLLKCYPPLTEDQ